MDGCILTLFRIRNGVGMQPIMCLIDMWIARNKKDGTLRLFKTKPIRIDEEGRWVKDGYYSCYIDSNILEDDWFDDLTWDDEPIEVEFVRKDEKPLAYCYNCKTTFSYDKKTLDESETMSVRCPTCGTDICLLD